MPTRRLLLLTVLASFLSSVSSFSFPAVADEVRRDLVVIEHQHRSSLEALDLPVTFRGASFFLAEWDVTQLGQARAASIPFLVLIRDIRKDQQLYLFELHDDDEALPTELASRVLYRYGRKVVVPIEEAEAVDWAHRGLHPVRLGHDAYGWARPGGALVPYDCAYKPIIGEILGKTSQAQYIDWIEKLSGVEPVTLADVEYTIATRYSSSMFDGSTNAKGFDFVKAQASSWHWPVAQVEEDPFSGTGGTWKNLVLTIPGQTNPTQYVLLTGHLDSIWFFGDSDSLAPGANDNGTGTATLLEAARLFRQYRFDRTIRIIFFTGEEQGLIGSNAYTLDHSMTGIQGVLNLDMFGYDSDGDRCFEIHAGTMPSSQDVGNCFNQSITEYSTNLTRDYLTSTATDRSDHASFWDVNVGAIEIAENFFNDSQPGGCVGVDPNPGYHTNNDTIAANMMPPYAFDIARTALSTIAAMAIPIQSCFASAPVLTATPATDAVDLSWTTVPGAVSYRLFRSDQGCEGQWLELADTTATNHTDGSVIGANLRHYYVEAVASDGFCVSAASNCASASAIFHHATLQTAAYTDTCAAGGPGDGNGVIEPGESVSMAVTLENDGNSDLTGLSGTLSTTVSGITVTDSSAAWPDLGPGSSSATLPDHFQFTVSPSLACGTPIDLDVASAANEGSWAGTLATFVGTPAIMTETEVATDVPKAVPNGGTTVSIQSVANPAAVVDVNVGMTVTHPADRDLDVYLIGPNGTRVELTTDNGGSQDNFTNTVFDDEAATAITSGTPPFTGSYRPEGLLSVLDGIPANGTWTLEVSDDIANTSIGTLQSWQLELTLAPTPVCNPCDVLAPPGEVVTVNWSAGAKTTLEWTAASGATTYNVYRGIDVDLPKLLDSSIDSCTRLSTSGLTSGAVLTEVPATGAFYWYLVRGQNAAGLGPAGSSSFGPWVHDPAGSCP